VNFYFRHYIGHVRLVQIHTLEVAAVVAKLVRLPRADGGSPTAGATLVEGVIESAGDSERYSSVQRTLMADAVILHYPAISAVISGNEHHRLDEALKRMKQALSAAP